MIKGMIDFSDGCVRVFEHALRIIDSSYYARTIQDVGQILESVRQIAPFRTATVFLLNREGQLGPEIIDSITYPACDEWLESYVRNNLMKIRPIIRRTLEAEEPVSWDRSLLDDLAFDDYSARALVAQQFHFPKGVIVPLLFEDSEHQAIMFWMTQSSLDIEKCKNEEAFIHALLRYPGEAIRRIYYENLNNPLKRLLTNRELQVLYWAAKGKTSSEIATILSISHRTVKFHLSNTYQKLGVTNRQQAVAEAVHHQLFDLSPG